MPSLLQNDRPWPETLATETTKWHEIVQKKDRHSIHTTGTLLLRHEYSNSNILVPWSLKLWGPKHRASTAPVLNQYCTNTAPVLYHYSTSDILFLLSQYTNTLPVLYQYCTVIAPAQYSTSSLVHWLPRMYANDAWGRGNCNVWWIHWCLHPPCIWQDVFTAASRYLTAALLLYAHLQTLERRMWAHLWAPYRSHSEYRSPF